jgi:hypothetical protein
MRLFILLAATFLFLPIAEAQDAKRSLRNAKRALSSYNIDPQGNQAKLAEAMQLIEEVIDDAEFAETFEAWYLRGNIYQESMDQDMIQKSFNPEFKSPYPEASLKAYQSYAKAYEYSEKNFQRRDALNGISASMNGLLGYGYDMYQKEDQATAFKAFEAALKAHELLLENNQKSPFESPEDIENQYFIVSVTAVSSGNYEAAEKYLTQMKNKGMERPEVYDFLYKLYTEQGREDEATAMLKAGRQKYPDDVNLLFSEINEALRNNKLDELVNSLQEAIDKEPNNLSLYATLGNVYDNLFQMSEDQETKDMYFAKAKEVLNKALELDVNNFESNYSMGALYYNKAAKMTQDLASLADDYSAEGLKKFDAKQKEVNEIFKESIPFFDKAHTLNAEDRNTLIALREIYARLNDFEKSNMYRDKLEALD